MPRVVLTLIPVTRHCIPATSVLLAILIQLGEADLRPNSTCLIRCGFVSTSYDKILQQIYNESITNRTAVEVCSIPQNPTACYATNPHLIEQVEFDI